MTSKVPRMPTFKQTLPPRFERLIREALGPASESELATAVMKLSDFYNSHPGRATPWHESWAVPATLAYFMPLNFARLRAVFHELERFLTDADLSSICDFGSGLGTTQWVLEESAFTPKPFHAIEVSARAREVHADLARAYGGRWQAGPRVDGSLAVFSYSFLEMQSALPRLDEFDHWLILEPSTRDCGRALMEWRSRFITAGFEALAPCTHARPCPLLTHSPRDWCHMRVGFEAPDWWRAMEDHLPMKNRTLTYSYLLLSRTVRDAKWRGATRVIGDTLEERGKTKQLICRGDRREFFSWLHKAGAAPRLPHGSLIHDVGELEAKGDELRVGRDLKWS